MLNRLLRIQEAAYYLSYLLPSAGIQKKRLRNWSLFLFVLGNTGDYIRPLS